MAEHITAAQQLGAAFERFRASLLSDRALSLVADEEPHHDAAKVLREGDAALMLSFADGLLTVRWCGPVSAEFLAKGHAWAEGAPKCAASAVVVDFTAARILFTGRDLDAALALLSPKQLERPRALLIPQRHASMFKAFAMRTAMALGVFQRGFLDRPQAEAWARETAARNRG